MSHILISSPNQIKQWEPKNISESCLTPSDHKILWFLLQLRIYSVTNYFNLNKTYSLFFFILLISWAHNYLDRDYISQLGIHISLTGQWDKSRSDMCNLQITSLKANCLPHTFFFPLPMGQKGDVVVGQFNQRDKTTS